jgi:hypothetical protein
MVSKSTSVALTKADLPFDESDVDRDTHIRITYESARSTKPQYREGKVLYSGFQTRVVGKNDERRRSGFVYFIDEDSYQQGAVLVEVWITGYDPDLDELYGTVHQVTKKKLTGEPGDVTEKDVKKLISPRGDDHDDVIRIDAVGDYRRKIGMLADVNGELTGSE